ncbi:hypothetical protein HGA34_03170 [Candidatus Falkowbacteria bacterium]|nr:hypothetical protein [Candidatus Falkowbacteria bacterium]
MRKNSVVDFVLAKKIVTAVMIFCQAVFLLPNGAHAQSFQQQIILSQVYVGEQTSGQIPLMSYSNVNVFKVRFDVFNSSSVLVRSLTSTSSALAYYAHLQVNTLDAGVYTVKATALNESLQEVYVTPTKTLTVTQPTSLNFTSPAANSTVSGTISLSVQSNDTSISVKFYYHLVSSQTYEPLDSVSPQTSGVYTTSFATAGLPNGQYSVTAKALKNSAVVATKEMFLNLYNQPPVQEVDNPTTTPIVETEPVPVPGLEVWMLEAPTSTMGQRTILARTNIAADSVSFIVDGPGLHQTYPGVFSTGSNYFNYSFIWNAQNVAPNNYAIRAEAAKDGKTVLSEPIMIAKLLPPSAPTEQTATTSIPKTATTSEVAVVTQVNIGSGAIGGIASGTVPLFAKTTVNVKKVLFLLDRFGQQETMGQALFDEVRAYWQYKWDTTALPNGSYNILAVGYDEQGNKFYSNSTLKIYIINKAAFEVTASATPKVATATPVVDKVEIVAKEQIKIDTTAVNKPVEAVKVPVEPTVTVPAKPVTAPTAVTEKSVAPSAPARQNNTSTSQVSVIEKPAIYEAKQNTSAICQDLGIFDAQYCDLYRFSRIALQACHDEKLSSKEECISMIRSKFGEPAICKQMTAEKCSQLFNNVIVDKFIPQAQLDFASQALRGLVGKSIEFVSDQKSPAATSSKSEIFISEKGGYTQLEGALEDAILPVSPFSKRQGKVGVVVLATASDGQESEPGVSAVLSIDSDSDGLSDDIESRLGTDADKADSDGDSFSDGDEVKTGHNPLGTGMLAGKLQPAEQALLNKATFEQPKTAGKFDSDLLKVEKVEIKSDASSSGVVKLEGKALPNQVFSLFIYSSLPIIVTVKTDQAGNWSYSLDKSLTDGKHEAYVVLNDEQGKIESKSAPFSFFVSEARAVSQDDLLKADVNVYNQTDTMLWWYASAGLILILFIAGLFFLYIRGKRATALN